MSTFGGNVHRRRVAWHIDAEVHALQLLPKGVIVLGHRYVGFDSEEESSTIGFVKEDGWQVVLEVEDKTIVDDNHANRKCIR